MLLMKLLIITKKAVILNNFPHKNIVGLIIPNDTYRSNSFSL